METLYQILAIIGAGLLVWITYKMVKGRPELFSKENISKSFGTMGVLGIMLIAFVAILVLLTRAT